MIGLLLSFSPVLVVIAGIIAAIPYWFERGSAKRGRVYVLRRNSQSCMVQVWMDLALAAVQVVHILVWGFWWYRAVLIVLMLVVAYLNWLARKRWLRLMAMAERFEIAQVHIPDYPPEEL